MKNTIFTIKSKVIILLLFCTTIVSAQMKYLGLKDGSNVRTAQVYAFNNYSYLLYWPMMQIQDNYIYVSTTNGIYRKYINTENNTTWEIYAFEGVPVNVFVKHNESILASTAYYDHSLLLLSTDDGSSYADITPSIFYVQDYEYHTQMFRIAQNPENPESLIGLNYPLSLVKSNDFGRSWSSMDKLICGYQNWFVGFHPLDTMTIYHTGESKTYEAELYASYDSGESWSQNDMVGNNCIHHIAFHPTNPDVMLYGGEGIIKKSTDKGKTWRNVGSCDIYIRKVLYDNNNPDILYATGGYTFNPDDSEKIKIFRSTDGGENWHTFYNEYMEDSDGILDMEMYNDNLYLFTMTNGIYSLDINELTSIKLIHNNSLKIYPEIVESDLYFECTGTPSSIEIYAITGASVLKMAPKHKSFNINVSGLIAGVYLVKVKIQDGTLIRKIIKK